MRLTTKIGFLGVIGLAAGYTAPATALSFCDYACSFSRHSQGYPWMEANCSQAISCSGLYDCVSEMCGEGAASGMNCYEGQSQFDPPGPYATFQCYT